MTTTPLASPPTTVTVSFWLYIVGAVLGVVAAIVGFLAVPAAIDQAVEAARSQGTDTGGVDVEGIARGVAIGGAVFGAVVALVFTVLTILFALKMRQGRNWARIVLAVFAGLQVFGVLGGYGVGALHFLVVLAALILSFLPASNAWFASFRAPRPAMI